jgi:hypothetical protein
MPTRQVMCSKIVLSRCRRAGLGALLVALLATLVAGVPDASAGRTWCSKDPLFQVGSDIVDVSIGSYTDMLTSATGPVKIVVTVPVGVTAKPFYIDSGFGYGYSISYATSSKLKDSTNSTQVSVAVYAPATDGTLPVQLDVRSTSGPKTIYESIATGTANAWVTVKTK